MSTLTQSKALLEKPLFGMTRPQTLRERLTTSLGERKTAALFRRSGEPPMFRTLVFGYAPFVWFLVAGYFGSQLLDHLNPFEEGGPIVPVAEARRSTFYGIAIATASVGGLLVGVIYLVITALTQSRRDSRMKQRVRTSHCIKSNYDCCALTRGHSGLIKCPECGLHTAFPRIVPTPAP